MDLPPKKETTRKKKPLSISHLFSVSIRNGCAMLVRYACTASLSLGALRRGTVGGGGQLEWHDRRARGRGCRCRPLHRDAVPVSVETLAPGKLPCRFRRPPPPGSSCPPPPPHPTPPQPRATASRTSVSLGCRSWPAGMHGPAGTCAGWGPLDERPCPVEFSLREWYTAADVSTSSATPAAFPAACGGDDEWPPRSSSARLRRSGRVPCWATALAPANMDEPDIALVSHTPPRNIWLAKSQSAVCSLQLT
jgi:hypothetical protein